MSTHTELVREAAGAVIDPELRRSLGDLGMIGSVSTENISAIVEVRLTIAGCPAAQKIESDVRAAALSVTGIEDVTVDVQVMTAEERAELLGRLRPGGPKQNPFGPGTLTRVIAVTSGKGGVGKSTMTANLAAALAQHGFRVGILDADVYGFSIPALMGLAPDGVAAKPTRLDDMIVPPVGHDVKVISIGMFVENANAAVAWRGPMLQRTITQFLTDVYFDLLRDYAKLDDNIIANSCAWYNLWVKEKYIQENMAYTFTLLQNNTNESLWNKCLEEYEEYAPQQQGGPLMFFLIIRRIQSNSETAIEHLKKQIKNLKLRDLPGENVDTAVSLIKTTYQALENASTPEHT